MATEAAKPRKSAQAELALPRCAPEARQPPSTSLASLRHIVIGAAIAAPLSLLGLWIAVNRLEWLGPYVADSLRSVVGTEAVADLEDFAYGVQDRFNRFWRRGEKPKAYWKVPQGAVRTRPAPPVAQKEEVRLPPFSLKDVGPAHQAWSAPGDGVWIPMVDPAHPDREPYLLKTLLHPDRSRSWAEVFVVAIDLRRVRVHPVAGSQEPVATEKAAMDVERPGVIPEEHREMVLAAFNGGFKTEHGGYGMQIDKVTFVEPVKSACAIAGYKDDTVRVASWETLADTRPQMAWWRQTPNCMIENKQLHARLKSEALAKKWGATLDGETVIRRSAIGISADGQVLFVSITNNTTAKVIAEGVMHAGAVTVAQLDVNYSYPKFVTFEPKRDLSDGEQAKRIAMPLADGFEFSEDEYIRKKSRRDFFYLMPKDIDERTAQSAGK